MVPTLDLTSVCKFVATVPSLRQLLESPVICEQELSLRTEMRRTLAELSETLGEAASEAGTNAPIFRTASKMAAQLAGKSSIPAAH